MKKRVRILQFCFFVCFSLLLGKLAYEQLYHSAILTGTISPDAPWILWIQQIASNLLSAL